MAAAALAAAGDRKARVAEISGLSTPVQRVRGKRSLPPKVDPASASTSADTSMTSQSEVTPEPKHVKVQPDPKALFKSPGMNDLDAGEGDRTGRCL